MCAAPILHRVAMQNREERNWKSEMVRPYAYVAVGIGFHGDWCSVGVNDLISGVDVTVAQIFLGSFREMKD